MQHKFIKTSIAVSLIAMLSACSSDSTDSEPAAAAAMPAASSNTDNTAPETPAVTAPVASAADTNSLTVSEEFAFDTARVIDIDFDIEAARGEEASVSICTKYAQDGDAFDVDYTSCAVRGPMEDGVFSHSMEITNEFDSVIAVVWFQDSSLPPLHQIFTVDGPVASSSSRGIRKAGDRNRVIVWK